MTRLSGNEAIIKLCEGWIIRCVEKSPFVGKFNVIDVFVKDGKLNAWQTMFEPLIGSHVIVPYPLSGKFDARDLITIHKDWTLLCKP